VNGSPLQFALRELRARLTSPRTLGVLVIVIVVLGLAGPFGTFDALTTAARFGYWAAVALTTYCAGLLFGMLALALARRHTDRRPRLVLAIASAACLPVTLAVVAINLVVLGEPVPSLPSFLELLLNCFFITLGIAAIIVITSNRAAPRAATSVTESVAAPTPPAILKRLPLAQRGALRYMSMQDHYVDVVTDKGHALVLMRLSDAIAETGSLIGLRIHRSHWVALDAVRSVSRSEGKVVVEMVDGARLPVSRSYLSAAREAGLFE